MRTIAIPQLYQNLQAYLQQRIADQCTSRVTNMIWLMIGLLESRSVQLKLIARKIPIRAKVLSLVKRLSRFLDNPSVQTRAWYHPFAVQLLTAASSGGNIRLVIDSTKVSHDHRLLMVSLAYHRRCLPIAWTWVRSSRGHSTTIKQIKLLAYVNGLLPANVKVSLVGDCEFGQCALIEYLHKCQWQYALRQSDRKVILFQGDPDWHKVGRVEVHPGEIRWLGHIILTRTHRLSTHLVLYWQRGEREPWVIATNVLFPQLAIDLYRRRMWIEEMFGDFKKHGFDLEMTHLRHVLRLSRLTLAVCVLYIWLVALGEHVLQHALANRVDRTDRRDLSIFRLGWDFFEDCLRLQEAIPQVSLPNFCSVSGG